MLDEETIQEQEEMFDDSDDLDWDDEEEVENGEENEPAEEDDGSITVKYNGKEQKVAKDDIATLVQKGLNYSHLQDELDSMRAGNMYKALKMAADKEGMGVEQYARSVLDRSDADALTEAEAAVRKEFPNLPNNVVKELAAARAGKAQANAQATEESAAEIAWAEALKEYPDITRDTIPQEVLDAVAKGKTPLIALKDHEIASLKAAQKKSAIEEKNQKNKEKSTGSMNGNRSDGDDQFLQGLFGG